MTIFRDGNNKEYQLLNGDGISTIKRMSQTEYDTLDIKDANTLYIIDNTLPYLVFDASEDAYIPLTNSLCRGTITYEIEMRIPTFVSQAIYLSSTSSVNSGFTVTCSGVGAVNYLNMTHSVNSYCDVAIRTASSAKHTYKRTPTSTYLDGTLNKTVTNDNTDESGHFIIGTTNSSKKGTFHLFKFNIYENDALVHSYVPSVDSNGNGCLKDVITNEFFYNSGTGKVSYERGEV